MNQLRQFSANIDHLYSQIENITKGKTSVPVNMRCKKCKTKYKFWDIRMLQSWDMQLGMVYRCMGIPKFGRDDTVCGELLTYNPLKPKLVRKALVDEYKLVANLRGK